MINQMKAPTDSPRTKTPNIIPKVDLSPNAPTMIKNLLQKHEKGGIPVTDRNPMIKAKAKNGELRPRPDNCEIDLVPVA